MKSIRTVLACIRKADNTYNLIEHGDKIVIGLSGGKDSIVLTYCLNLYKKFSHTDFTIQPVTLDLGFPGFNGQPLIDFCHSIGLELKIVDSKEVYKILQIQQEKQGLKHLPCSICSRMKKAAINKVANELGFNKVAFAHHVDDALETLMMNAIHGSRVATFAPKMHLENADITFIRPLMLVHENDIKKMVKEENLPVLDSHCPADKTTTREDIKILMDEIYKKYPQARDNFLTMLSNYEQIDVWGSDIQYQVNQEGLTLRPVTTPYQMYLMSDIRIKVFVEEQGFSYDIEMVDEEEKQAKNFLFYLKDTPIGCIRYRQYEDGFKIERFAILKEYRSKGYGRQILNFFSDMIGKAFNPCNIYIHAQEMSKDFYLKCGYQITGDPFMEGHVLHYPMVKKY